MKNIFNNTNIKMEKTYKNDYDKLDKLISEWYIKNDKEKKK